MYERASIRVDASDQTDLFAVLLPNEAEFRTHKWIIVPTYGSYTNSLSLFFSFFCYWHMVCVLLLTIKW